MALASTPQITASLTVVSPNLLNDSLSLSVTSKLYKAGTSESLDQTSGLSRKTFSTAVTDQTLFSASDYTDSKSHKIYIKNTSSDTTEFVTVSIAIGATTTNVELGLLYGGDFAWIPWSGEYDIDISTSDNSMTVEYMLIYEA